MSRRLLSIIPLLCACAAERDLGALFGPAQDGLLVVDAQLIVDASLPPVYLSQTQAHSERTRNTATHPTEMARHRPTLSPFFRYHQYST